MKRDIVFAIARNVKLIVVPVDDQVWDVLLLNSGTEKLETVLVTIRGYGALNGQAQQTSQLRHTIESLDAGAYTRIEGISNAVLHLTNEYWVSYYIGRDIFDKKFVFVPDSIIEKNLTFIPELNAQGVLHD